MCKNKLLTTSFSFALKYSIDDVLEFFSFYFQFNENTVGDRHIGIKFLENLSSKKLND